ncbi:MAG: type II toxin-antitoxin system VapC family toxin [Gemmatimonadaceae bacterium]
MRSLLDTNVLSEIVKPVPNLGVVRWVSEQPPLDFFISTITIGEIAKGIHAMPAGRRRDALDTWVREELTRQFLGRVLPVDERVAHEWGRLAGEGKRSGRPLAVIDGLLLATASAHTLTFVTRNEEDCANRGVPVHNPWS